MWNDVKRRLTSTVAVAMVCGISGALLAERTWTRSEVLAIADKEAKRLGYDTEHMGISFDAYNSQWDDYRRSLRRVQVQDKSTGAFQPLSAEEQEKQEHALLQHLENRGYLAVYYGPMERMLGGDLWVFIDRDTGEILKTIRGQ